MRYAGSRVGAGAPGEEARDVAVGGPEAAVELWREQPQALFGKARLQLVNRAERRVDVGPQVELGLGPGGPLVGRAFRRRERVRHLPRERRAQRRILAQQLVQDARARARRARDEDGCGDLFLRDRRIAGGGVDHLQPGAEVAQQIVAGHEPAECMQTALRCRAPPRAGGTAPPTSAARSRRARWTSARSRRSRPGRAGRDAARLPHWGPWRSAGGPSRALDQCACSRRGSVAAPGRAPGSNCGCRGWRRLRCLVFVIHEQGENSG